MRNSRSPTPTAVAGGRAGEAAPAPVAPASTATAATSRQARRTPHARVMSLASAPARRSLMFSVGQVDALDRLVLDRPVARAGRRRLDRLDGVHALRHLSEHRVLAIEPRRRLGGDDEELLAGRV